MAAAGGQVTTPVALMTVMAVTTMAAAMTTVVERVMATVGGATVLTGGLISGGLRVGVDPTATGVTLDVAVGGTGLLAGDIQGFGSVILNDATSNTDNAIFLIEGASGAQSDLRQGQQVLIVENSSSGAAEAVLYRANVKGPVTAVDVLDLALGEVRLVVLGQTVISDGATTVSNVKLANILLGDELEVSGVVAVNGDIVASFIEKKSALDEYKVIGKISQVTATQFTMGGLIVDYASATLSDFDSGMVVDGDVLEVKALPSGFTSPNQLEAIEVEQLPLLTVGSDVQVRVEGFIDRFDSSTDFSVQSAPIVTDGGTTYQNGSVDSLALGVKVQIEGTADSSGGILAQRVTIQPTKTLRAEGNIEAIDQAPRRITVLGLSFLLRDLTELDDDSSAEKEPLVFADLAIGDEVEVRGYLDGANVVATSIEREDLEDRARLRGLLTAIDLEAATLDVQGVTVNVQEGLTEFEGVEDNTLSFSEFYATAQIGQVISVKWDLYSSLSVVADQISIEEAEDD